MRISVLVAIATFSSTVLGQNLLDQIPKCAQTCFGNNLGTCGQFDIGCICGNKPVINGVSCCVFATCPQSDIQKTIDFATKLCKLQNIDVDTTPDCPSNSTASSSSASASASGSASATSSVTGSASPTATGASTGAAASSQIVGAGLGLGIGMAGLLAFL